MAHDILVNSKFTQGIFKDSFKFISKKPLVLYPGIRLEAYEKQSEAQTIKELKTFVFYIRTNSLKEQEEFYYPLTDLNARKN